MKDNDLITCREVELALLEKGQKSKRYKFGEIWELNFDEIREALSEYQPKIVRCKDCVNYHIRPEFRNEKYALGRCDNISYLVGPYWFCADGKRR